MPPKKTTPTTTKPSVSAKAAATATAVPQPAAGAGTSKKAKARAKAKAKAESEATTATVAPQESKQANDSQQAVMAAAAPSSSAIIEQAEQPPPPPPPHIADQQHDTRSPHAVENVHTPDDDVVDVIDLSYITRSIDTHTAWLLDATIAVAVVVVVLVFASSLGGLLVEDDRLLFHELQLFAQPQPATGSLVSWWDQVQYSLGVHASLHHSAIETMLNASTTTMILRPATFTVESGYSDVRVRLGKHHRHHHHRHRKYRSGQHSINIHRSIGSRKCMCLVSAIGTSDVAHGPCCRWT